ncbi:hypothetical protein KUCAC02_036204, partial [Chaenocephalus aceratus]
MLFIEEKERLRTRLSTLQSKTHLTALLLLLLPGRKPRQCVFITPHIKEWDNTKGVLGTNPQVEGSLEK